MIIHEICYAYTLSFIIKGPPSSRQAEDHNIAPGSVNQFDDSNLCFGQSYETND